ncbi:MAG TPA: cupin domain-containing protein [Pseudolabrys sp.]|jgi:quercetin dioxygenase-like cupin family protein|nr:cupin domain-containing protein [Pseudolabrys sp.]
MAKAKRKVRRATTAVKRKQQKKIAAKAAKTRWSKQYFTVSHLREEDFDHGLRPYSAYRDLGLAKATGGRVQAHVIRMTKPFDAQEVATPHYHDVEFQMVYVLKGWFRSEFDGHGTHTFHAGSCWMQPPKIRHTVRGYSDDCELLEIVLPADFKTVTLAG